MRIFIHFKNDRNLAGGMTGNACALTSTTACKATKCWAVERQQSSDYRLLDGLEGLRTRRTLLFI